jgi:hypothetical protein
MMGKLAWPKVILENRRTIFKLIKEAIFGRNARPKRPQAEAAYEEVAAAEVHGEVSA